MPAMRADFRIEGSKPSVVEQAAIVVIELSGVRRERVVLFRGAKPEAQAKVEYELPSLASQASMVVPEATSLWHSGGWLKKICARLVPRRGGKGDKE